MWSSSSSTATPVAALTCAASSVLAMLTHIDMSPDASRYSVKLSPNGTENVAGASGSLEKSPYAGAVPARLSLTGCQPPSVLWSRRTRYQSLPWNFM